MFTPVDISMWPFNDSIVTRERIDTGVITERLDMTEDEESQNKVISGVSFDSRMRTSSMAVDEAGSSRRTVKTQS